MRVTVIFLVLVFSRFLCSQETVPITEKSAGKTVAELIVLLGADDFHDREMAVQELQQLGRNVFRELQDASLNPDLEVAERAKKLLLLININWVDSNDTLPVREIMRQYAQSDTVQAKIGFIGELSDWSGNQDFQNGEGVYALCRIVHFERDPIVRAEAVRAIIALPPLGYSNRFTWFQTVIKIFEENEGDFLIDLLRRFATIRNEVILFRETFLFTPDMAVPEHFREQVIQLQNDIRSLRDNRIWSEGRKGTDSDILLFYAIAELQEALKLDQEVKQTVQEALDVVPIWTEDGLSPYLAHYLAALYLEERNCPKWANGEYEIVARKEPRFKSEVFARIGGNSMLLNDMERAAESYRIVAETVAHPLNPGNDFFSGNPRLFSVIHKYCLGQLAFEKGEIINAKELLEEAFKEDPLFADGLILRFQIGLCLKKMENAEKTQEYQEYTEKTGELIEKVLKNLTKTIEELRRVRGADERTTGPFNQTAWILANTGGDYGFALQCITEALALDPDNPNFLDTLAHVYYRNQEYEKAMETERRAITIAPQILLFHKTLKRFEIRE